MSEKNTSNISIGEKLAYGIGDAGSNIIWALISSFLILYYTDHAGIAAASIGTMMLIIRLLDGGSDILMGFIVDRTKSRWGKARPWIMVSAPLMGIGLVLLFNVPQSFDETQKLIYAYLTYAFITVIVYTMVNLPYNSLLSLITSDQHERSVLTSIRFGFVMPIMTGVIVVTPYLINSIGFGQLSFIFGVIAFLLISITFWGTKERVKTLETKSFDFKTEFKAVSSNRFFWLYTLIYALLFMINGLSAGSGVYFARDILGNIELFGLTGIASMPGMLLGLILFPKISEKFGKWKVMMAMLAISAMGLIPSILYPSNVAAYMGAMAFRGLSIALAAGLYATVADIVEYGEYKTGIRTDGLIFSSTSFGTKVGMGLGTAFVGWTLAWGGYQAGQVTETSLFAIKLMALYTPFVMTLVIMVVLWFANVDKVYPEVRAGLKKSHTEHAQQSEANS